MAFFLKFVPVLFILFFSSSSLHSQENGDVSDSSITLRYKDNSTYYLVERSNWSHYVNGKYIGLTHRENRASLSVRGSTSEGTQFSGFFYILQETLRDMTRSARSLDEITESAFIVQPSGQMIFTIDNGFPQLRSFPVYPEYQVKPGDRWEAEGIRIVDPRNTGNKTALPIFVQYEFKGKEEYKGEKVFRIKARYATRINKYQKKRTDDPDLQSASGIHDVDILIAEATGAAILILDRLDETFFYTDGTTVRFKGNTALFTEIPVAFQPDTLIERIDSIIAESEKPSGDTQMDSEDLFGGKKEDVPDFGADTTEPIVKAPFEIEKTAQGIRLSVRDIRFYPDSDRILPEEEWRLAAIAKTLALVPKGRFLIEGHTASVGKVAGEKELSIRRAQKITEELSKRGLTSEQFIFTGYGGTRPLADNKTAEGRAKNRRVEITILE